MVSLEGIVTKCSLVRPKVIQSVHYSEKKNRFYARKYRDQTMTASGATSLNVYPTEDEEKNPVRFGGYDKGLDLVANFITSSSLNMDTAPTWITKPSRFRRCLNGLLQASCPEEWM